MKLTYLGIYFLGSLLFGVILLPGTLFVNNYNLSRNLFFACFCCIIVFIVSFFLKKEKKIQINVLSICAILCLCLCVIRNGICNQQFVYIVSFVGILTLLNQLDIKKDILYEIIALSLIVENFFCLLQFLYIIPPANSLFKATGSFENPNTFGLYTALCYPMVLDLYKRQRRNVYLVTMMCSIIFASLMGCRISLACMFLCTLYMCGNKLKAYKRTTVLCLFLVVMILLSLFEANSSKGRLLIQMSTIKLLTTIPLDGLGYDGFTHEYMDIQSEILASNFGKFFANIEGSPMHPLNEYLLYFCNIGIIGIVAIAFLIFLVFKQRKLYDHCMYSCIVTIVIQSLFTYSLRYAFTWILVAVFISQSSRHDYDFPVTRIKYITMFLSLYCTYTSCKQIQYEIRWKNAWNKALCEGITLQVKDEYATLYKETPHNTFFLFNYAYVLHQSGEYAASNMMIKEYNEKIIDYQSTALKADNFFEAGEYCNALSCYREAHLMCPSLFAPMWKQVLCYKALNDVRNAKILAKEIVKKEEKNKSYTIDVIKAQCVNILSAKR